MKRKHLVEINGKKMMLTDKEYKQFLLADPNPSEKLIIPKKNMKVVEE